ncbi:MAG: aromatic amino acid lyase [Actinomycetota bacterium]|nr:aromatic amino acid lyase [Actinomycetota bacterium]
MITIRTMRDVTTDVVERIAWRREHIALDPELLNLLKTRRTEMLAALHSGARVYGVNTGTGYLAGADVGEADLLRHQRNLLLGRAVGSPPWLSIEEARAVLVARLSGFLSGHAGVTPELCLFLAHRLNDDFIPAIPRHSVGSSGEVLPLAHAFQTFVGAGHVLASDGSTITASQALEQRSVTPYEPQAKEGIALLAGAPGAIALALAGRRAGRGLWEAAVLIAAAAIDALQAPLDPYDRALGELTDDPLTAEVLDRLGVLLLGSSRATTVSIQAPVSYRVIPQVLVHLARALSRLEADVARALASVGDSPVFTDGRFLSNGSFHAIELAAGLDSLGLALVRVAELSGQRTHRLLDNRFSGLPDQLAGAPGHSCGLVVVQKRVLGCLNRLRRLGAPASIGIGDTSLGQEDAMTFSFEAAASLRRMTSLVSEVFACELLVIRQAWVLRDAAPPPNLQPFAARLSELVEPVVEDRPLGPDVDRIITFLEDPSGW